MSYSIRDNTTPANKKHWRGSNNAHENIAVHYLGVKNAENPNLYYVDGTPGFGGHFYIWADGTIDQQAPVDQVLYHVGTNGDPSAQRHPNGLTPTNYNTIGIEMWCGCDSKDKVPDPKDPTWYYTKEQQEALVWLVRYLCAKYHIPYSRVFRHHDITGKWCPAPYCNNNGYKSSWTWNQFKMKLSQEDTYMFEVKQIQLNSTGNDVRLTQMCLKGLGYIAEKEFGGDGKPLEVDGKCGPNTVAAIKAFQKANGLKIDGVCGPATFGALIKL